ncbi:MAG: adenylate/guanylate cyclase domain-containing protein [Alphaproteobacteria bacterium]|nr:adenylate/guanylate cyclase domain-containing protein [Alphaproteobacteria bacterium]
MSDSAPDLGEVRLFLEEICGELCRMDHVARDGVAAETIVVRREVSLGRTGAFADLHVAPAGGAPYFVEVKWGYSGRELIERLARKYDRNPDSEARRLLLVSDLVDDPQWPATLARLRERLSPDLAIEAWGEYALLGRIRAGFALELGGLTGGSLRLIRDAVMRAEWQTAFGEAADERMMPTLLWHFSPWTLARLRRERGLGPDDIMRPGTCRDIVVVIADLCAFSSYVRDTRDDALVRLALTSFYSQARQAVLDAGGMMDKFVGDEVIGVFGYPDARHGDAEAALACARRLVDIGESVSDHWQRRIDRMQDANGVHIGIAMGDLNLMRLRAFSSRHYGFIGEAINMAARLMAAAGPSEIVVSNRYHQALGDEAASRFAETPPIDAKNVGRIKAWKFAT